MNKIVEEQLKQCVYADITNKINTDTYLIKQYTKPQYVVGKCYLIKLPKEIVKNPNTILATNWNNGSAPQHEYYKAYVSKSMAKMIYCDCLAYDFVTGQDIQIMWSGWFDAETLTQIKEVF